MNLPLCECGCGERVSRPGNRFVHGHHMRGRKHTEESKREMSERLRGRSTIQVHADRKLMELPSCGCDCGERVSKFGNRFVNGHYWRGKKHTEAAKRKQSERQKGEKRGSLSEEHRRKISEALKGREFSEETRSKMSEAQEGSTTSEETKRKLVDAATGRKHTKETKRKQSESHKGLQAGEKNPSWRGGISFEPYGPEFNGVLKLAIRQRDGFTCQLCGLPENGRAHDCHHIDFDKQHNVLDNFNTLCLNCHRRTNSNRSFWTNLFQARMKMGLRLT